MEQERILKKNEIVFSDTLGVCQVAKVSNLTTKRATAFYTIACNPSLTRISFPTFRHKGIK